MILDLTSAYKSLLAEKQALEITIKALKTKTTILPSKNIEPTSSSSISEHESGTLSDTDSNKKNDDNKVSVLTSNIQLLLDNKSKMEKNYQAEKKKLRSDLEEAKGNIESLQNDSKRMKEEYEKKLQDLKGSLKQSQLDRDKLSQEVNTLLKSNSEFDEHKILSMHEEHQSILLNLRTENNDLRMKLKSISKQFDNKCEELIQCDKEMKQLKTFYDEQKQEMTRQVNNLRAELDDISSKSENRIEDLESRISEMYTKISSKESKNNINSLKDDTSPNKSYSRTFAYQTVEKKPQDFDAAIEQITALKSYIESTAKDLNINFNFNEIWLQTDNSLLATSKTIQNKNNDKREEEEKTLLNTELESEITQLKEENRHLKEEYDKYKVRTNYLIKSAKQSSKVCIVLDLLN
jgi:chromosome segregation ATPase